MDENSLRNYIGFIWILLMGQAQEGGRNKNYDYITENIRARA